MGCMFLSICPVDSIRGLLYGNFMWSPWCSVRSQNCTFKYTKGGDKKMSDKEIRGLYIEVLRTGNQSGFYRKRLINTSKCKFQISKGGVTCIAVRNTISELVILLCWKLFTFFLEYVCYIQLSGSLFYSRF